MKRPRAAIVPAMALLVLSGAASAQVDPGIAARIEAIPIRTLTISDGQFLTGDSLLLPTAQTWLTCELREEPRGVVVSTATSRPFTWADECIGRGAHVGYDAAATERTRSEVSDLLSRVFDLRRDP